MIKTLSEVKVMLEGVTGMTGKVAYYSFPEGQAPALPFIVFYETASADFRADNKNYFGRRSVTIEYYAALRNMTDEGNIEAALDGQNIPYHRVVDYISDERCFRTSYEIEV